MNKKEKIFVGLTLFYIAYLMFPYVSALLPVAAVSVAVSVLFYFLYPNSFRHDYFKWFLIYIGILLIYCLFGHKFHINGVGHGMNLYNKLLIETAWILPNIMICSIITKLDNPEVYRQIGLGAIGILILSLLAIFPTIWTQSGILRENLRLTEDGNRGILGLPSYTVMSCYSYFIPVACYGFKHSKKTLKWIFFGILSLFLYYVFKSEITTSLLATIFVLLFMIVYKEGGSSKNIVSFTVFATILWFLYETGGIITFLNFLINAYEGTVAQVKLIEFRGVLLGEGESGNVELREQLRERSFASFALNPFVGSYDVGGHSSLIDRLGSMGLLGFIPFVMMIITNVRVWLHRMPNRGTKSFYICGILVMAVFLYNKGLFSGEGWMCFFVILPVCILGMHIHFTDVSNSKWKWKQPKEPYSLPQVL